MRLGSASRTETAPDISRLPAHGPDTYALICANLISTLLLRERKRIVNRLRRDGVLVVAGILKSEFAEIRRAYEGVGMLFVRSRVEGEWESGVFAVAHPK